MYIYNENVWHVSITQPIVIQYFAQLEAIFTFNLVNCYSFAGEFVPTWGRNQFSQNLPPEIASIFDDPDCYISIVCMTYSLIHSSPLHVIYGYWNIRIWQKFHEL